MLQHTLKEYKMPLGYIFDSKTDTLKTSKTIYLRVIDKLNMNDTTKVKDDGFLVVPLAIAGGYKGDFTVTLGKKSVVPSFLEFVSNSLQTEASRSGNFKIKKRAFRSDYILEMTLLDCQISAKYHKDRIRYGLHTKENWLLKPILGKTTIEVKLLENKKVVFDCTYSSSISSQLEVQHFSSESSMNLKMMEDFARTTSLEIKEILEATIQDVNGRIE
ncbi:MAG TPA: hypothetical protein VMW01_00310 [Williamwhitmania sp.]|nr:hypothetical protein [Williamwhitmania sp.]